MKVPFRVSKVDLGHVVSGNGFEFYYVPVDNSSCLSDVREFVDFVNAVLFPGKPNRIYRSGNSAGKTPVRAI